MSNTRNEVSESPASDVGIRYYLLFLNTPNTSKSAMFNVCSEPKGSGFMACGKQHIATIRSERAGQRPEGAKVGTMSTVDGGTLSLTLPFSEFTHSRTPIIGELTTVCHCHHKVRFTAHDTRNIVLKDRTIQPAIATRSLPEHEQMFDDPIDHLPNLLPKSPPQPALPPFILQRGHDEFFLRFRKELVVHRASFRSSAANTFFPGMVTSRPASNSAIRLRISASRADSLASEATGIRGDWLDTRKQHAGELKPFFRGEMQRVRFERLKTGWHGVKRNRSRWNVEFLSKGTEERGVEPMESATALVCKGAGATLKSLPLTRLFP